MRKRHCILGPRRRRKETSIKQNTIQYLERKNDRYYELRKKELVIQEKKQQLEERKLEMENEEKQRRWKMEDRRLQMEEDRFNRTMELFNNLQSSLQVLLNQRR